MRCTRRAFLGAGGAALALSGRAVAAPVEGLLAGPAALRAQETRTVEEEIRKLAEKAPLRMKFTGSTAEECRAWQGEFAAKLRSLLGPHAPPREWKATVKEDLDRGDHRVQDIVLAAEGVPPLPVYLLLPKGEAKAAGVLAIHGHGAHGHAPVAGRDDLEGVARAIQGANYDYGRQLVRKGYVVAAPCLTPFGRRLGAREAGAQGDRCADAFIRLQLLGKLLIAENLRDCLWAFEFLARHDRADAGRMACVGLSYGGRMTTLVSALEPRIRVAVISGALNVMQERIGKSYSCGAQVIPGLLESGDVPEIGSLIAPRPCVWEVGSKDGLITEPWAGEALARMGRAWRALGAEDRLLVDRFEGGHEWSGRVAVPLLEKTLR